jgi:hypothetical protein
MKKLLTMVCVLVAAGTVAACETAQKEVEIYEARQAAERAEAKADAALAASRRTGAAEQRMYDASQRK